jgi:hypothetical protein
LRTFVGLTPYNALAARSIARPISRGLPSSGKSALQTFDIELLHLHHDLKGPLGFLGFAGR